MHRRRGGQDVARLEPRITPRPVADAPADFEHQRGAGRDVPRIEAELEESVERARRGPGQVHGRGARTSKILKSLDSLLEHREISRENRFVAEGKDRRYHGGRAPSRQATLAKHRSARAGGAEGDGEEVAQTGLSSRPRPNIASRSWAENCWKATMVCVRSTSVSLVRCWVTTLARSSCSRTLT